ncbi:hypothetical protein CK203_096928 [Vitis vinifera]|uniref:Uncharacterized protein n=1 Tax=Vitis vinifera TaxID=29760 RepID=A0A438D021_VITVI|nr:hypothetical protein CK203_096928 [Vitis vinifera]
MERGRLIYLVFLKAERRGPNLSSKSCRKKNGETKGQTSETGLELDGLSYEKLMEIVNKLDKKLESVESLIDLKRGEAGWMSETLVNCPDHMPVSDGGVESDLTWTMMNLENNECPELGEDGTVPTMQGTETIFYDLDFADLSNGGVEFDLNGIMMNMENNEYPQLGGGRASSSDLLYQSDPAHGMFQNNTDPSTSYQNMGTVPTMQGMSVSENTMMFNTSPTNSMPQMGLSQNTMPDIDQSISMQQIAAYMQYLLA